MTAVATEKPGWWIVYLSSFGLVVLPGTLPTIRAIVAADADFSREPEPRFRRERLLTGDEIRLYADLGIDVCDYTLSQLPDEYFVPEDVCVVMDELFALGQLCRDLFPEKSERAS